jgi:dTDP-glucose 4,6-dehydratase
VILNALEGKALPVYGDGKNVRDWLYVTDHCEAIWTIMNRGKRGETYNVGGNWEMENIVIVEMICDILDEKFPDPAGKSRRELITFVKDRPGHDRRYAIDFSKLRNALAGSPGNPLPLACARPSSGMLPTVPGQIASEVVSTRIGFGSSTGNNYFLRITSLARAR